MNEWITSLAIKTVAERPFERVCFFRAECCWLVETSEKVDKKKKFKRDKFKLDEKKG